MKKFLSVLFSIIFTIFGVYNSNLSYAHSSTTSDVSSATEKTVAKETQPTKKYFTISEKQFNGIKNVVSNPFAIILRAGIWAILAKMMAIYLPIGPAIAVTIGLVCGGISMVLDLYVEGYEKAAKKS